MHPGRGSAFDCSESGGLIYLEIIDDVLPDLGRSHPVDSKVDGPAMSMLGVFCTDAARVIPESGVLVLSTIEVVVDRDRLSESIPDKLGHCHNFRVDKPY